MLQILLWPSMTLIFDFLHLGHCETTGICHNICPPGLVKICQTVLEICYIFVTCFSLTSPLALTT